MSLKEKVSKIVLVSIVFGAVSIAIIIANDIEPDSKTNQTGGKKKWPSKPQTKAQAAPSINQNKKILKKEELELLSRILEFNDEVPKELSARIAKIILQPRPANNQLEDSLNTIAGADELAHLISKNGDLIFNIEVLSESKEPIFLGSLEDSKTKNRIFELSWQKKTR